MNYKLFKFEWKIYSLLLLNDIVTNTHVGSEKIKTQATPLAIIF